jgi:integrase
MAANYLSKSRHGTIYFFKRRIPKQILSSNKQNLSITNKSVLTFSLRTSDLKEARIRARWLAVQSDWLFQRLIQGDHMLEKRIESEGIRFNYGFKCEFDEVSGALKSLSIDTEPGNQSDYEAGQAALQAILGSPRRASAPNIGAEPTTPSRTLSAAIEEYLEGIAVKSSTSRAYRTKLIHFMECFGPEREALTIDQRALVEYSKRAKESISNPTTSNQYIKAAGSFLRWIRIRAGLPELTTRTLTQKRTAAPYRDRDSFSMSQMKLIFGHALKYRKSCPAKYWVTLIAAFTGARLEEIAQVDLNHDLKQSEAGIWYFDLNQRLDEDGCQRKSLKKLSTERVIAIHSALVERGLIEYLQSQVVKGFTRPFESQWKPLVDAKDGDYKWNHQISKWGSKEMKLLKPTFTDEVKKASYFHSHRHTLTTVLANKGVTEEVRSAIEGQKSGGGVNGDTYTKIRLDPALSSKVLEEHLAHYVEMLKELEATL